MKGDLFGTPIRPIRGPQSWCLAPEFMPDHYLRASAFFFPCVFVPLRLCVYFFQQSWCQAPESPASNASKTQPDRPPKLVPGTRVGCQAPELASLRCQAIWPLRTAVENNVCRIRLATMPSDSLALLVRSRIYLFLRNSLRASRPHNRRCKP